MKLELAEYKNLGIICVDYGFGWARPNEAGTDIINNILEKVDKEVEELKQELEILRELVKEYQSSEGL